jgi:transcriptional regulator with XRE-family HTH domain
MKMSEVSETCQPDTSEAFGVRLRRLRKARNLSQAKLGERIGAQQTYITELETSKITNPSSNLVSKLARALDISIEELTGQVGGSLPSYIQSFSQCLAEKNVTERQLTDIQQMAEIYLEAQENFPARFRARPRERKE